MRLNPKWRMALGLMVATACAAGAAHAQVAIQRGGTPARLEGLKTVVLEREIVSVRVGKDVHVVGRYRLKNRGKSGTIKIGFPAYTYADKSILPGLRVASDGRILKTRLTTMSKLPKITDSFYAFSLKLKRNETREISCDYRVIEGGFFTDVNGKTYNVEEVDYMNGGGSTWNGPVGSSLITFRFEKSVPTAPLRPFDMAAHKLGEGDSDKVPWSKLGRNAVPYLARGTMRLEGTLLRISRSNFRPKVNEVTTVFFDFQPA